MREDLIPHETGLAESIQDGLVTNIVTVLEGKRDKAVQDRAEVEARWLRDLEQFEGNTIDRMVKGDVSWAEATKKAPPVVHLTRSRTMSIAARIINMLVPTNERSWNIEPTPVPRMAELTSDESPVIDPATGRPAMVHADPEEVEEGVQAQPGPDGQPMRPVTKADLAKMELEEAEDRCNRMREHMDDQLVECRYNAEQRKVIVDGCKLGTGILEGPCIGGSYKKKRFRMADGVWVTQVQEESAPEFRCVDPWNFYPISCEHISRCDGVFIDKPMTRRELQELKMLPGFNQDMINEVLAEEPMHGEHYLSSLNKRANASGESSLIRDRYSVWKYTGSLSRRDMEALGVDVDELDIVDPLIEAWFCNTRLLKIKRHPLEGAYRLPYCVWNYEENETSIFGYGVPYLMRDSDRVIQSTWHMILHNAAQSAGSHIVRRKGEIEPADGDQNVTGGTKQWYASSPDADVRQAFGLFSIPPNIDALSALHERARQNADEELAFPLLAQGEPSEAVPTSSGLAMLLNASNVVQRRIAQSYDDEVLEPSITALYDYNMIYLQDDDAKGDMKVRALGASKLVVKDMQAQHLLVVADITTNDRFAPWMKDNVLLEQILKAADIDPDMMMREEEEVMGQGPSEREMADLEYVKSQTAMNYAKAQQAGMPDQGGMNEKDMAEITLQYDRMEADIQIQQMKLEQAAIEAAHSTEVKLEEIRSRFQINERREQARLQIEEIRASRKAAVDGYMARLKAQELAQKKANMARGFDTF